MTKNLKKKSYVSQIKRMTDTYSNAVFYHQLFFSLSSHYCMIYKRMNFNECEHIENRIRTLSPLSYKIIFVIALWDKIFRWEYYVSIFIWNNNRIFLLNNANFAVRSCEFYYSYVWIGVNIIHTYIYMNRFKYTKDINKNEYNLNFK